MSEKPISLSLYCCNCDSLIDVKEQELMKENPPEHIVNFLIKHNNCILEGFINGRSIGGMKNKLKDNNNNIN